MEKDKGVLTGFKDRFKRKDLWRFFLLAAFPVHLWGLFILLGNLEWIAERTNMGDAVGYAGYSLVLAFLESVSIFILLFLVSLALPKRWDGEKRLAVVGGLYFILAFWAMVGQFYFWADTEPFTIWWRIVYHARRLDQIVYPLTYVAVFVSAAVPAWFLVRSEKWARGMNKVLERLEALTVLYLVMDAIGLVIVLVRNL